MNWTEITAPVIGGILGVALMRLIGRLIHWPWLDNSIAISSSMPYFAAFVIGATIFWITRRNRRESS